MATGIVAHKSVGLLKTATDRLCLAVYQMRVSMSRSLLPSRPMQAFKNVSSALRCLFRLFTTSVPAKGSVS